MNTNTVRIYEILKDNWGEKKATIILDYLESETTLKVEKEVKNKMSLLATKEDIYKLELTISDKYANIIKWLFVFWIGTIGTMVTIIKVL